MQVSDGALHWAAPVWRDRLQQAAREQDSSPEPVRILPMQVHARTSQIEFIGDRQAADRLLRIARQEPLAWYGLDFEFRFARPPVLIRRHRVRDVKWSDPVSLEPLLAAVTLASSEGQNEVRCLTFVLDVRCPDVVESLGQLMRLPVPLIAHFAQAELCCLWKLGLPTPRQLWDTWVAERAFLLGRHHPRYLTAALEDNREDQQAAARQTTDEELQTACDLVSVCRRYAVDHPFATSKERLQQSFLDHRPGQAFSAEQIAYAAADADAAVRIYPFQVSRATALNGLRHLIEVEMPWTITNARMHWDGVYVDPQRLDQLRDACRRHVTVLSEALARQGLQNVLSHPQLTQFFRRLGLLDCFRQGRGYSFDDDHLGVVEERHSAIAQIRLLRRVTRLLSDKLLSGDLVGADQRLHPEHRQLGADSTRNAMRHPNIGGIGKALRPLVVPQSPQTHAIGEVDLSQIEVGIAAAVYGDRDLIAMFNEGDVYSEMARRYFADRLSDEDRTLRDAEFKTRHRGLRSRMKVYTLAIIYNITPVGLARQLGSPVSEAAAERTRFLQMFPQLSRALEEASQFGVLRGYAELCTGLRRHRGRQGSPTNWEINWMRNTPVQGSAAVVFKVAGNRLRLRYEHYGARLILPLHDAFVFECPREHLETVAEITREVMCSTVQEMFPELRPQADVNIGAAECWNKDGHAESFDLWIENPASVSALFGW